MTDGDRRSWLITGGSGFIGSAVVRRLVADGHAVTNVDAMTYAGTFGSTASVAGSERYRHVAVDITDRAALDRVFAEASPDTVMHLAAESHVDRSIDRPSEFVMTNVIGTTNLLEAATEHWESLDGAGRERFRFHHVSTDEVFGALGRDGSFTPDTPYDPRSPYSASKASADHFVRAWNHTFGLPVVMSNCSNNYGPFQLPEKLIPKTIVHALMRLPIPVYGRGEQVRDWLHVDDHVAALLAIAIGGTVGETYLVGGGAERTTLEVVQAVCASIDRMSDAEAGSADLISFVEDRPGHDFRYSIDYSRTTERLAWSPLIDFEQGIEETVKWYVANRDWWEPLVVSAGATSRQGLRAGGVS
ncbi:MAG: dTDP-glucose 4,6-dehydratase [Acidimicrobiia bacterium]